MVIPVTHHLPPLSLSKLLGGGKTRNSETSVLMEIHKSVTPKCLKTVLKIQSVHFSKMTPATPELREILSTDGKSQLMPWVVGRGYGTNDGHRVIKVHGTFFLNQFAGLCGHGYALRGFWRVAPHSHVRHSVHRHLGSVPLLL